MKLLLLLLFPLSLFAQKKHDTTFDSIPKGTNTVIVKGVAFDSVVNKLLDANFKIAKIDKDFKTVRTEYKEVNVKYTPEISLDIRVKDSTAIIAGKFLISPFEENIELQKATVFKMTFNAMNNYAKSLNGVISYEKR